MKRVEILFIGVLLSALVGGLGYQGFSMHYERLESLRIAEHYKITLVGGQSPTKLVGSRDQEWRKNEFEKFFEALDILYSDYLVFSNETNYLRNIDKYYLIFDSPVKIANSKYADYLKKSIREQHMAPLYVKWVNDVVGYGVYADSDIKKGDFLLEYIGIVVVKTIDSTYSWSYPCIDGGFGPEKRRFVIDGRLIGNISRLVNDPKDLAKINCSLAMIYENNCYHLAYLALRDIKKGEQIFISYGDNYWSKRDYGVKL